MTVHKRQSSKTRPRANPRERKNINLKVTTVVLTEAGYRCAVPTCRQILALDMHHMYQVAHGGGDHATNLIALCPTCHRLYHRGEYLPESIYAWKSMLVSLGEAFDLDGIDRLLFLRPLRSNQLIVSGDGLLHFSRLIAAGLAEFSSKANNNFQLVTYSVRISQKGRMLVDAWKSGKRSELDTVLDVKT